MTIHFIVGVARVAIPPQSGRSAICRRSRPSNLHSRSSLLSGASSSGCYNHPPKRLKSKNARTIRLTSTYEPVALNREAENQQHDPGHRRGDQQQQSQLN